MAALRGRLRIWIVATVVFPAAPLAALLPLDCCAAHGPDSATLVQGSESAPAPDPTACPMHRSTPAGDKDCLMRSGCNVPMTVLAALLGQPGVLGEPFVMPQPVDSRPAIGLRSEHLLSLRPLPDTPPPRA